MKQYLHTLTIIFVALLASTYAVAADDIIFTAQADNSAIVGQPFRLQYQVNESGKDLRLPSFDGFEIISGPQTSTSSSTQVVNGKVTRSKSTIYTYILLPKKEGEYTIGAATITVGRERYHSNSLKIKVLPEDKSSQSGSSSHPSQNISADNLFVKAIVSRTKVYEQEAIVLTYKLFFRVDITNIQPVEFPDFNGFLVQEIELPTDRRPQVENYNGMNYSTYEIRKVLLFPQSTGKHKIDEMSANVIIRLQTANRQRSFFDSFFDSYQEVEKRLTAPAVTIDVNSLPQPRPANFSGIVGSLSLKSDISTTEVNADEPVTITLKLSGSGNLKMLKTPELNLPTDFEAYEPKVTSKFTPGNSGLSGYKTIEYLAIPRHNGDFTIPPTCFSYFDPDAKEYKTISTPSYNIKVHKSNGTNQTPVVAGNFQNSEKVTVTATDIRYINTDPLTLVNTNRLIAGTPLYWLLFAIPAITAILLTLFFRKQIRENADMALVRNKKANKVARKRLTLAEQHMRNGKQADFFDEVLKALWGYIADKLSIPVAELNKDNIAQCLSSHNVNDDTVKQFIDILNECEYQRYAPSADPANAMDMTYTTTVTLISTLENSIKRHSSKK